MSLIGFYYTSTYLGRGFGGRVFEGYGFKIVGDDLGDRDDLGATEFSLGFGPQIRFTDLGHDFGVLDFSRGFLISNFSTYHTALVLKRKTKLIHL